MANLFEKMRHLIYLLIAFKKLAGTAKDQLITFATKEQANMRQEIKSNINYRV